MVWFNAYKRTVASGGRKGRMGDEVCVGDDGWRRLQWWFLVQEGATGGSRFRGC